MKYSTKLSDTIHLLAFLCLSDGERMTSARIAESEKRDSFLRSGGRQTLL